MMQGLGELGRKPSQNEWRGRESPVQGEITVRTGDRGLRRDAKVLVRRCAGVLDCDRKRLQFSDRAFLLIFFCSVCLFDLFDLLSAYWSLACLFGCAGSPTGIGTSKP